MAAFEAKLAGNAAFKQGKLELALSSYSTAIKLDPHEAVYYLNRSAVYLKLLRWSDVEKDTTQAIQLDPKLTMKAAFRRGIARREAGDLRAREDFKLALEAGAAAADVHAEVSKIPKVRLFSDLLVFISAHPYDLRRSPQSRNRYPSRNQFQQPNRQTPPLPQPVSEPLSLHPSHPVHHPTLSPPLRRNLSRTTTRTNS